MGLIHGGTRHWLDQGNGINSWGHATLAGSDDGSVIYEGTPWGRATLAGPGRWD